MMLCNDLMRLGACSEAIAWVGTRDLARAWEECARGDWMLWLASRVSESNIALRRAVVLAACECAAPEVRRHWPAGSAPRECLRIARAVARGRATGAQVAAAASAAYTASAAVVADDARAAYAAYAADASARAAAYAYADAADASARAAAYAYADAAYAYAYADASADAADAADAAASAAAADAADAADAAASAADAAASAADDVAAQHRSLARSARVVRRIVPLAAVRAALREAQ